jgi:hypothetical protein
MRSGQIDVVAVTATDGDTEQMAAARQPTDSR